MYRLYIVHVVNNIIILTSVKLNIIFSIDTLWYDTGICFYLYEEWDNRSFLQNPVKNK
jgi:hypothetical protein